MYLTILVVGAMIFSVYFSADLAKRGANLATKETARLTRANIASMLWVLVFTNALLAGILAVLVYPYFE